MRSARGAPPKRATAAPADTGNGGKTKRQWKRRSRGDYRKPPNRTSLWWRRCRP
jgi:hypothetical protein